MYLDSIQAAIKQCLDHDATVSKIGNDIVEGNKFSFRGNIGTVAELEDDKGDPLIVL